MLGKLIYISKMGPDNPVDISKRVGSILRCVEIETITQYVHCDKPGGILVSIPANYAND